MLFLQVLLILTQSRAAPDLSWVWERSTLPADCNAAAAPIVGATADVYHTPYRLEAIRPPGQKGEVVRRWVPEHWQIGVLLTGTEPRKDYKRYMLFGQVMTDG